MPLTISRLIESPISTPFFFILFALQSRYEWFYEAFLNLFMFLYPGLLCSLLLFWMVYGVGVRLAGKSLPLVSREGCRVVFLSLQSFNI
jgi:hypothetical protein